MSSPLDFSLGRPQDSSLSDESPERQITFAPTGHTLTNINAWTADGEWLVYDLRLDDKFATSRIEMVSVRTGEVRVIHEAVNGAKCGVATTSPTEPKVLFMQGPEHPTADWDYGLTKRRGMLLDLRHPGVVRPVDAMNYAPPFAPGALRGGSHLHVFSPDGTWVSFTYEDEVLARPDVSAAGRDPNQRNLGVALPGRPVRVATTHPRNHDGDFFCVVVTHTAARPQPGSDEISRACEESWIGRNGYLRRNGSRQQRALAFQGMVTAADGVEYPELFVVDLPDSLLLPCENGRLIEGTGSQYPAPPRGVNQRRLTFTADRRFPGVARTPRHWPQSTPDGASIIFLMADEAGGAQFWSVGAEGDRLRQISRHPWSVASSFTCSPDGKWLGHVMDNSIFLTEVATGRAVRLTARCGDGEAPLPQACVFSPDGRWLAYTRRVTAAAGVFPQIFRVAVPGQVGTK